MVTPRPERVNAARLDVGRFAGLRRQVIVSIPAVAVRPPGRRLQMHYSRHIGRSVVAVLAGFVTVAVVTTVVDVVLHTVGVFPPWGERNSDSVLLLATSYRLLITVAGGYITARLAPDRPMSHAVALGIVGTLAAIGGAAATWNAGPAFEQKWYPLLLVVTALPCTWTGGRLFESQSRGVRRLEAV